MARSGLLKPAADDLRLGDHVSVGVLMRVFPPDVVDEVIERSGAAQQRYRLLPSRMVVYYVMALSLFVFGSYEEVMRQLLAGLDWLEGRFNGWEMPTKAAIFKARVRVGSGVLVELFKQVAHPLAATGGPGFCRQWRLVSVDGTSLDIPDTVVNEGLYGRPATATASKSAYPQVKVLGLVESGTHAVLGAEVAACSTSEHTLFPKLFPLLGEGVLLTADRGLFSYTAWKDCLATGTELLWRMKSNSILPVQHELPDGSYLSTIYPSTHARKHNSEGIQVRVIEYTVTSVNDDTTNPTNKTKKTTSTFRLITSLLDPTQATPDELAHAYGQRWEIENCFDELKTHQRGPGIVLRSKTPDGVLQEIFGYLCVHYALRTLINEVATQFEEDPLRISFTRTLRAARRSITSSPDFPPSRTNPSPEEFHRRTTPRTTSQTKTSQKPQSHQTENV
jgi:hypothetical protein